MGNVADRVKFAAYHLAFKTHPDEYKLKCKRINEEIFEHFPGFEKHLS